MASRSAYRNPERWISWEAARNKRPRMRSGSRGGAAPLRLGWFLVTNIPTSMHVSIIKSTLNMECGSSNEKFLLNCGKRRARRDRNAGRCTPSLGCFVSATKSLSPHASKHSSQKHRLDVYRMTACSTNCQRGEWYLTQIDGRLVATTLPEEEEI
jgi:hypothetical protein